MKGTTVHYLFSHWLWLKLFIKINQTKIIQTHLKTKNEWKWTIDTK